MQRRIQEGGGGGRQSVAPPPFLKKRVCLSISYDLQLCTELQLTTVS